MITSFGLFKSVRENTPDPCVEVYFSNTGSVDAFFEVVTCDGNNIIMDLGPFESSINYCVTNDSWVVDPNIVVNTVQIECLNDGDTTAPAPAPSPAPTPSPTPSPGGKPSPPSPPPGPEV